MPLFGNRIFVDALRVGSRLGHTGLGCPIRNRKRDRKRCTWTHTGKRPCEDGGRDQSDVVTS